MLSRKFQRWMGSHSLVALTLMADAIGAWASFFIGQYILPAYGVLLEVVLAALGDIGNLARAVIDFIAGSIQASGSTIFLITLIAGATLGLILGIMVATRGSYGYRPSEGTFGQGAVTFLVVVLVALLLWFIYALVMYRQPFHVSFSSLQVTFAPNMLSGWLCLAFYLVTHLFSYVSQHTPNAHLSRAHPGGPKWQIIEHCYHAYRTALIRFAPVPLPVLKMPEDLCFHEVPSKIITWDGRALVIPESLMQQENWWQLQVELARQLMYYNGPDLRILQWLGSYPHPVEKGWFLMFLGNFIILPALVQHIARERWEGERVLDADRYAFLLGQGGPLRKLLRQTREAQQQAGVIDKTFPSLGERIDQLDALIADELGQMKR